MEGWFGTFFSIVTLRSALDILIVAALIYRGLLIIRGTRASPMLTGLTGIVLLYLFARWAGFVTLVWILETFLSSLILVVVIIFQDEIRRALTKVGLQPLFRRGEARAMKRIFDDVVVVVEHLSEKHIGALLVLQREVGLDELVEEGAVLDAIFNRKLLYSLFIKDSPLHDGAVIIQGDRIKAAGCVLPLSFNPDLDPNLGTRHRAALGLSERSDAVVVVVSEETGAISLAFEGKLARNLDGKILRDQIAKLLMPRDRAPVQVKEEVVQ